MLCYIIILYYITLYHIISYYKLYILYYFEVVYIILCHIILYIYYILLYPTTTHVFSNFSGIRNHSPTAKYWSAQCHLMGCTNPAPASRILDLPSGQQLVSADVTSLYHFVHGIMLLL